ncbi:FAD-binding domain containing protein [Naviculisporaceae sp. PSN 640]
MTSVSGSVWGNGDNLVATGQAQYLTDEEISRFLDDLDHDGDGMIDYDEVERKLDAVHDELIPQPRAHNILARKTRAQSQKTHRSHGNNQHRHEFLRSIIGSDARRIPRDEFAKRVKEWNIPSLELSGLESNRDYVRKMSPFRRIRAHWAVHGPEIAFLMLVVGLQIAFGVWQLAKYTRLEYVDAFGWGVGMAKLCAGALYPTMFFLIISMSRYVSTLLRRSYHLSRFINWDLSQSFHIKISCVALFLSTLHTIGHLSGTFRVGSEESREPKVALLLGADDTPVLYGHYIVSVPGLTGLTALGLFYVLALLSMPHVRRWNYELFQMGHLLMYPIVALMCAHGTSGLLQFPMMGYWLAIPTFFVLVERLFRLALGFHNIDATVQILDGETVEVTVMIPERRFWNYRPGQYILFQVPKISRFQWHPFTVSVCVGKKMQLHIKTDGDWTGQLRELADESGQPTRIVVGINGPFGAPAQKFYDYDHAIVVGSGIGVTPFSGILSDLQARDDAFHGRPGPPLHPINSWTGSYSERLPPVEEDEKTSDQNQKASRTTQTAQAQSNLYKESLRRGSKSVSRLTPEYRRVDFHWTVRERNYLLWISDLLNSVFTSQQWHPLEDFDTLPNLDIRIHTHVTGILSKSRSIATHVYAWLLEMHRTPSHPASPLTGLLNPTQFGRPDFVTILDNHYEDMVRLRARDSRRKEDTIRVGVFYCGTPAVGAILADRCRALTARGHAEGTGIEYHFVAEVFG